MICIGLGSNLGSREAFLRAAESMLDAREDVRVEARSALYLTPPIGPPQPDYLNAALRLETPLHPRALLGVLQGIERASGRVRKQRWGPRTLDLDILWWSGPDLDEPGLTVPHARLHERPFAIAPLLDVAPELADRYRCLSPPERSWTVRPSDALDALDGLAFEANQRLGPSSWRAVRSLEDRLPEHGAGFVVLRRWDAEEKRGLIFL